MQKDAQEASHAAPGRCLDAQCECRSGTVLHGGTYLGGTCPAATMTADAMALAAAAAATQAAATRDDAVAAMSRQRPGAFLGGGGGGAVSSRPPCQKHAQCWRGCGHQGPCSVPALPQRFNVAAAAPAAASPALPLPAAAPAAAPLFEPLATRQLAPQQWSAVAQP